MSNSPLYARQMAKQFVDNVSVAEAGKEQGFEGNAIASIGGVLEEFLKAAKKGKEKRDKEVGEPFEIRPLPEIEQEQIKEDGQVNLDAKGVVLNEVKISADIPQFSIPNIIAKSPGSNLDEFKASYELLDPKEKAAYEEKGGYSRYEWDQTEGRTPGDNAENEAARAWASRNQLPKGLYLEKRDGKAFRESEEYKKYLDAGILSQRDGGEKSTKEWNKDWNKVEEAEAPWGGSTLRYPTDGGIDVDSFWE